MKLKVFGGSVFNGGSHCGARAIIAVSSQKKVAEVIGSSLNYVGEYWSVTANREATRLALANPGVLLIETKPWSNDYRPAVKKP